MILILTSIIEETNSKWLPLKISEELILDIGNENMEAFRVLYEETNKAVYGFAYSILKNTHDANDVMQDTYVQIHANAKKYKCQGKPMAWIFRITRNLALMKIREGAKMAPYEIEEQLSDPQVEFSTLSEDRIMLEKTLCELPDEERQILILYAVSGLKHREIAAIMNMNLATELSKYRRTIKKMKKLMMEGEKNE